MAPREGRGPHLYRGTKATVLAVAAAVLLSVCATTPSGTVGTRPDQTTEGKPVDLGPGRTELFNGNDLTGWRVVAEYCFEEHGKVYVQDGTVRLEEGNPMTGISWAGDFPKVDYEVSLEAMRVTGSDFFCGMTCPVGQSWFTLIVGGWGGMVVGLSNIDGLSAAENRTTRGMTFELNRWYAIRVRVTVTKIEAWIDGEQVIEHARMFHKFDIWWEQEPVKPFGIATWYTGAALRNITLRRL